MTLVAVYRYGPFAIVLNDFRITHDYTPYAGQVKRIDACMKYAQFGTRMGMFFAGDVAFIQQLIPLIRRIEPQLTTKNVIEEGGILRQTLLNYSKSLSLNPKMSFQAIGFILDVSKKSNEIFKLEGISGTDTFRVSQVPSGRTTIIGDGSRIPRLADKLTVVGRYWSTYKKIPSSRRKRFIRQYKYDQNTVAEALERKLKSILRDCGTAVYKRLGISPHFAVSLIGRGAFVMQGRHIKENFHTTDFIGTNPVLPSYSEYSLERNSQNQIVLRDHTTGQQVIVDEIEQYRERRSNVIFNLSNTSGRFDVSSYEASDGYLYIMNQWVQDDFVERDIKKCIYLDEGFYCPDYIHLAMDILQPIPGDQMGKYLRSGTHVLYVSEVLADEFETSVMEHVFDHSWLEEYVRNYLDYFMV